MLNWRLLTPVFVICFFKPYAECGRCNPRYSPSIEGLCEDEDECTGGSLQDGCGGKSYMTCCIPDNALVPELPGKPPIEDFIYLELVGETTRTLAMYPFLNKAMVDASLESCHEKAVFLSQILYTTSLMRYFEEENSGKDYENDVLLGNTQAGDGRKFIRRGVLPVIGRKAYSALGTGIGMDLLSEPELLALPSVAFKAASWLWRHYYRLDLKEMSDGTRYSFIRLAYEVNKKSDVEQVHAYWQYVVEMMECPQIEPGIGQECVDEESGDIGYCKLTPYCKGETVEDADNCGVGIPTIKCCLGCKTPVDLVFLMDSSGSIEKKNFITAKKFVRKVVKYFKVSVNSTRVAVIRFTAQPKMMFNLIEHTEKENCLKAIDMIPYVKGGTRTDLALLEAVHEIFNSSASGVRPVDRGVPRVVVVMTDGRTNGVRESLIEPARMLKDLSVNIFSIGIGKDVDEEELNLMATDPDRHHVFMLKDFDEVVKFIGKMSDLSCYEPAMLFKSLVIRSTVGKDEVRYYKVFVQDGVTAMIVQLTDEEGKSLLYVSHEEKNPDEKSNNFARVSSTDSVLRVEVRIPPLTPKRSRRSSESEDPRVLYIAVKGTREKNSFALETYDGQLPSLGSPVTKIQMGMMLVTILLSVKVSVF